MNNKTKVFIDGESGTTGLEIRSHLELRSDIDLINVLLNLRSLIGKFKRAL